MVFTNRMPWKIMMFIEYQRYTDIHIMFSIEPKRRQNMIDTHILVEYYYIIIIILILEADLIRQLLFKKLGTAENPVRYDAPNGGILSDYSTPGLQSMAFPTLFPYGVGDVTRASRRVSMTLTESNKHLLNYAVLVPRSDPPRYFYPFAVHGRWMHWAQNTAERRRAQGQKKIYIYLETLKLLI